MKARVACLAAAFLAPALAAACSDEAIVLATISESASDGGMHHEMRCSMPSDCYEGSFCDKKGACDSPYGECEHHPVLCGNEEHEVCGCDGVTYFNDCLRKAAGVTKSHDGECTTEAVTCGGASGGACPGSAVCAILLGFGDAGPGACSPGATGTCWVVPPTCPLPTTLDRWDECHAHGARCLDTCSAIQSGEAYFREAHCG
jgi:hypothetical protein